MKLIVNICKIYRRCSHDDTEIERTRLELIDSLKTEAELRERIRTKDNDAEKNLEKVKDEFNNQKMFVNLCSYKDGFFIWHINHQGVGWILFSDRFRPKIIRKILHFQISLENKQYKEQLHFKGNRLKNYECMSKYMDKHNLHELYILGYIFATCFSIVDLATWRREQKTASKNSITWISIDDKFEVKCRW